MPSQLGHWPITPNSDQIEWCWDETLEAYETITKYRRRLKGCSSWFIGNPWPLPRGIMKIAAYDFWDMHHYPVQWVLSRTCFKGWCFPSVGKGSSINSFFISKKKQQKTGDILSTTVKGKNVLHMFSLGRYLGSCKRGVFKVFSKALQFTKDI